MLIQCKIQNIENRHRKNMHMMVFHLIHNQKLQFTYGVKTITLNLNISLKLHLNMSLMEKYIFMNQTF